MEITYFDKQTGAFLNNLTVEDFFSLKIDFSELFDQFAHKSFPVVSDITKCYYAFQMGKTLGTRVNIYYMF